jgi:hypothetical protein
MPSLMVTDIPCSTAGCAHKQQGLLSEKFTESMLEPPSADIRTTLC